MSSTMHDDNSSHGNELLERAVKQLQATELRDDMPREVSDRILTIVGAQGSVPAKTSTRRFIVWQIITVSVLAGVVFLAVGSLRNGQQDGPSAIEQNKIENTTPNPDEAADQGHERGSSDVDVDMQNNIRTLKERMSLNRLSLDELRRIAANPDWKEAKSRYPVMRVLGDLGEPDLIPFLETLKPWQTDFERNKKVVEGHNRIIWPAYVAEAIGSIRRRHWETPAKDERE